jgi:hypothetical protein
MKFKPFPQAGSFHANSEVRAPRLSNFSQNKVPSGIFFPVIRGPGSTCINGRVAGLSFISPNDQSSSQFAVNYPALKSWGAAQTVYGGTKCGLPEKSEIAFRPLRRQ